MKQFSIFGLGKMGAAIAQAAASAGYRVTGYDPTVQEDNPLTKTENLTIVHNPQSILGLEQPVILAVKPNQVASLVSKIPDQRLIISIAAGVGLETLLKNRGIKGPVIRAMPNNPLVVGLGMTALIASQNTSDIDKEFAQNLFASCGDCIFVDDEKLMHIVTGLSGSGPAYVYLFLQSLEDAGVQEGLPRALARRLAIQTVAGSAIFAAKAGRSPQDLIHDVTSPGGTTIAAMAELKEHGFEAAVAKAVSAATERSKELSND